MERNELKGKQTPGKWLVDARATAHIRTDDRSVASAATHWTNLRDVSEENDANAALIAEAGTVANETGMWPLDMLERIKELEEALRGVLAEFGTQPAHDGWYDACVYKHEVEHARAILNKKV